MKVVAVFIIACIAVALAYPMDTNDEVEIRPGYPVVYNQGLNTWEAQIQQKCDEGVCYVSIILKLYHYVHCA